MSETWRHDLPVSLVTAPKGMVPVVDALNDAVIVADLDGRIVFANLATQSLLGWSSTHLVGCELAALVPERLRDAHRTGLARFASGAPARIVGRPMRLPALRPDGREVAVELLLSTLPTEDGSHFVVGTMRDVRERVDLERDSSLAHHVLEVVSTSTGSPDALGRLLEAVASTVAWQAAALWEPAPDDRTLRCAAWWSEEGRDATSMSDASRSLAFARGSGLPGRVWAANEPTWIPDLSVDDNYPRAAVAATSGLACGLAFPLTDRGDVVGVVELYRATPAEPEPSLLDALADLGAALGSWLMRSRLQEALDELSRRERTAADAFRRTLVPPDLPDLDGVAVAAAFVPGGDVAVGGDFYDVFVAADRVVVTVGDVCGSGPQAAAVSGQVRHSLRALSRTTASPAAICAELNSLMVASSIDNRFCTANVASLVATPTGGVSGVVTSAGHPAPIVVRADGSVERAEGRGTLLGVLPTGSWVDRAVALEPGDRLVLFTDGVTEASDERGELFGEDRLTELCATLRGASVAEIVDAIRAAAVSHAGRINDDIAIVAVAAAATA